MGKRLGAGIGEFGAIAKGCWNGSGRSRCNACVSVDVGACETPS